MGGVLSWGWVLVTNGKSRLGVRHSPPHWSAPEGQPASLYMPPGAMLCCQSHQRWAGWTPPRETVLIWGAPEGWGTGLLEAPRPGFGRLQGEQLQPRVLAEATLPSRLEIALLGPEEGDGCLGPGWGH